MNVSVFEIEIDQVCGLVRGVPMRPPLRGPALAIAVSAHVADDATILVVTTG